MGRTIAVLAIATVALAGCSSSSGDTPSTTDRTTLRTTTTTAPKPARGRSGWSGNGVFSVGAKPSGGAKVAIPPARYTVELKDGAASGYWVRCSALPCSLTSSTMIDLGHAEGRGFSTVVDVLPTDGAVYLEDVTFYALD